MALLTRICAIASMVLLSGAADPLQAQVRDYEVKAAFIYNFAKFVEWPPAAFAAVTSSIAFCVFGDEPIAASLKDITAGKLVKGRSVQVVRVLRPENSRACHILFLGASDPRGAAAMLAGVSGQSVLTIGDTPGFAGSGGIIGFFLENNKVRFAINPAAARENGLLLGSGLLAVARIEGRTGNP